MAKHYFSADGTIEYGEKFKHFASVSVELPDPEARVGFIAEAKYDPVTGEGSWNYVKILASPEEELQQVQQDLGTVLFESANDKARIAELEVTQGEMLMEIAMLKMGGSL